MAIISYGYKSDSSRWRLKRTADTAYVCGKTYRRRIWFGADLFTTIIILLVVSCPVHSVYLLRLMSRWHRVAVVVLTATDGASSSARRRHRWPGRSSMLPMTSSTAARARSSFAARTPYYYYYYYYYHYTSLGQQPVYASGATRPAPTCIFLPANATCLSNYPALPGSTTDGRA